MKKCSKALKKRVSAYTEVIFNDCICEVFEIDQEDGYEIDKATYLVRAINAGITHDIGDEVTLEELKTKRDKVGSLYQEKLCKLPTVQLNEIVKAHQLPEGFRRAPKTIETIISELARRSIFDDSNESETKNDYVDVDGPRRKSKKHSQKTSSKRRKTSKGRSRNRTN